MKNGFESVHPTLHSLLATFTDEMIKLFGENLSSLLLYGSGAGENYIPGKSNVNVLLVLREQKFHHLLKYQRHSSYWKRKGVDPPLICTVDFLEKSSDVFPMEWLEMMSHHVILHGESPFKFSIDHQDLRRQCEKEIREIQIRLRQAFLESQNRPEEIERLALVSLNSVFPVLRSILVLQKEAPPVEREKLIELFFKKHRLSSEPFLKIWEIKKGKLIPQKEFLRWFEDYLDQLDQLSDLIDQVSAVQ